MTAVDGPGLSREVDPRGRGTMVYLIEDMLCYGSVSGEGLARGVNPSTRTVGSVNDTRVARLADHVIRLDKGCLVQLVPNEPSDG